MRNTLAQNIDNWVKICASDVVLDWLQNGVKFPICNTIETSEIPNKSFSRPESVFIRSELQSLLIRPYRAM